MSIAQEIVPVDVVVTGVIRDRDEFDSIFKYLLEKRQKNSVRNIVFSTWKVVAKNRPNILKWCQENDIKVVVTVQPGQTMAGNTWMQHKALLVGLEALPDLNHPVLKTRTDKALDTTQKLLDEYEKTGLQPARGDILQYKLLCLRVSLTMPFYFVDYAFIGLGYDLRKMIHFDGYYDVMAVPHSITAEMRMFSWPFVNRLGFVDEYFRTVHSRNMSTRILQSGLENAPDYLLGFFFKQYKILSDHFQLPSLACPDTLNYSLSTIWKDVPEGIGHHSQLFNCTHCSVSSDTLLKNIAELEFKQDEHLERVEDVLKSLKQSPDNEGILQHFSQDDLLDFDQPNSEQDRCLRFDSITLSRNFGVQQPSGLFGTE